MARLWIGLLLGWVCSASGGPREYEIAGRITHEERGWTRRFEVFVRGCDWLIGCQPEGSTEVRMETAGVGGGELYALTLYPGQQWGCAIIESNAVPAGLEESATPILWLALASACYLDHRTNRLLRPVYDAMAGEMLDRERVLPGFWERVGGWPSLPTNLVYWNPGRQRLWNSARRRATQVSWPPPYDRGFTNACLRVLALTNRGGLILPRTVLFEEYAPGSGRGYADLRVKNRMRIEVELAQAGCSRAKLLPALPARVSVQDRRLCHLPEVGRPVSYSIHNGRWPGIRELRRIWQRQERGRHPERDVILMVAVFLLAALVPVMVGWRQRRRHRRLYD